MESLKKYIVIFSVIVIILCLFSCKEKIFTGDVNCDECYDPKPDSVDLKIYTTLNDQFEEVPFLLYKGNIDNGTLIDTFYNYVDSLGIEHNQVYVKADAEYSAKAIYKTNERTVFVVDGTKQQLKKVTSTCDNTCWVIEGNQLYLELAY
jgi:hypothetical protein